MLRALHVYPVNRTGVDIEAIKWAQAILTKGHVLLIFPEGTRKKPGDAPDYKSGFVGIYKEMNTKILPVALNSGKCWPKNTLIKKPGHIIIKFLPLLEANIDRKKILSDVEIKIEEATNKII